MLLKAITREVLQQYGNINEDHECVCFVGGGLCGVCVCFFPQKNFDVIFRRGF